MNLLISYYKSQNEQRNSEYLDCLTYNLENQLIEKIFIFIQTDEERPIQSEKIEYITIQGDVTYQTFFDYAKENLYGEICIVANSDIFFDDTLEELKSEQLQDKFLCLTRWNLNPNGTLEFYSPEYGPETSQDVWIFKGGVEILESNVPLGYMGCDNRIASIAFESGLDVSNPSHIIICKHLHNSQYRTTAKQRIYGEYLFVTPSDNCKPSKTYKTMVASFDKGKREPSYSKITKVTNFVKSKRRGFQTEQNKYETGVLITGATGLVGTAIKNYLKQRETSEFSSDDVVFISSKDYDLRRPEQVQMMFTKYKPKNVIHLAGMVGGVQDNSTRQAEFYTNNTYINTNVLHFCHKHEVSKVLCMLSSCIYPDSVEYPIKEECLHNGPPHESNFGYAYSKRMLEVQMRAYRNQYGCNFFGVIPTNIFGENDNYNLTTSHVIPAIIRKVYDAMILDKDSINLWGDGTPQRQFSYSADIAKILVSLIENDHDHDLINIGDETERSIQDVASTICDAFGFTGDIIWDSEMPNGQQRKPVDMSLIKELGLYEFSDFTESISKSCAWFEDNQQAARS